MEKFSKVSSSSVANSMTMNTCPGRIKKSGHLFGSLSRTLSWEGTASCWAHAKCKVELLSTFLFELLNPAPYTFSAPATHKKARHPNSPPTTCPVVGHSVLPTHLPDFCHVGIPCTKIHRTLFFKSTVSLYCPLALSGTKNM